MRYEYEIDEVMFAVFELSRYADVPAAHILDALSPVVFDENELDYINKNWDIKSEG